jgi:hypothetical protein
MDIPTPTPPPPISGYRSRAINAAVDFAAALRPVAGPGVRVADGPGGKTISVDPRGLADVPRPWTVRAVPLVGAAPSQVDWEIRVYGGLVVADGAALSPPTPDGTDAATGLPWYDAPEAVSGSPYLCVANDGEGSWSLSWEASPAGPDYRAIARLLAAGPPPRLAQLDLGVVDLGGGDHWGVFDDPTSSTPWETGPETQAEDGVTALFAGATVSRNTADGTLTITPVSRTVSADSRGNVREIGGESAGASVVLRENMGVDGVGIDDIDSGTSTESGGYTITPITITLTDGTTVDLLVRAKNGADGADGEDGARGPRGPQGEQGPPGPTVQVQKQVVIGVRYDETSHQLQALYSTITCQAYQDNANWTPFTTAVAEMP